MSGACDQKLAYVEPVVSNRVRGQSSLSNTELQKRIHLCREKLHYLWLMQLP
jgi:hypothetical protein